MIRYRLNVTIVTYFEQVLPLSTILYFWIDCIIPIPLSYAYLQDHFLVYQ